MVLGKPIARTIRVPAKRFQAAAVTGPDALQLLIMTQFFPPDFAATGQLIEELVQQLGRQQVDVKVFTGQPGYAFAKDKAPVVEQTGRVWVKRSRMTQLFPSRIRGKALNGLLFAIRCILHLIKRSKQYQVLLVTTAPPFLPVIGYLANLFLGLPYVCLLYDLYPDIAVELKVVEPSHSIIRLWKGINQRVWRRASGIIVLSPSMKAQVIASCPEVADKVSVIHSWANEQIVCRTKADNWFARKHRLVDPFVVMYSGNMGRCHDIETIFETARQLQGEPVLFVCIGGGAKRQPLVDAVTAAGLKNFLFLPYQEKAVLPYSLTACDLSLVSVEAGMESLVAPSKLYPAMAAGKPIAAICPPDSYLGPLLEAAQGGAAFDNGESQQLAMYIRHLSQHRDETERLGAAGRRYVEANFTAEAISQQYLAVLLKAHNAVSKQT
ncbi:MAG: glycosyltransferase family 4 protein [Phormidesmis sp.]